MQTRLIVSVSLLLLAGCSDNNTNKPKSTAEPFVPKDALYADQWHLNNTGTAPEAWGSYKDLTKGADIGVTGAWQKGVTGKGVVVTVMDDGIDFTHPDLKTQEKTGGSFNFATGTQSAIPPEGTSDDQLDHGTSIAGIIAAKADDDGVVGIAPDAQLIGYRAIGVQPGDGVEEVNPYTKLREDDLSQLSNHSYGPDDDGQLVPQSEEEYDAIKALVTTTNGGKGHVMVFAAGNGRAYVPRDYKPSEIDSDSAELDTEVFVQKNLGDYAGLDLSQQHPYIISVSGFDANDKEVTYTEAGPAVLLAGATGDTSIGSDMYTIQSKLLYDSLKPKESSKKAAANLATTGRFGVSYSGTDDYESARNEGTAEPSGFTFAFDGSSAAAPTVTGVAALMRSANPELTWRDVRWILAKTARKIQLGKNVTNTALGEESTGEFAKPLWSEYANSEFGQYSHYLGYGAVNAASAVTLATDANYTLLPEMKTCVLPVTENAARVGNESCPQTIEFVQVKYTVSANTPINDLLLSMNLAGVEGKTINLIAPSTCSAIDDDEEPKSCKPEADVTVRGGTVGYMGDTLGTGESAGFDFASLIEGNASNDVTVAEVTVYGFNR